MQATANLDPWQHRHDFCPPSAAAEKGTRRVLALTVVMMIVEIIAGLHFHSMALFADGCHMGTHCAAFLITAIAYAFARRHLTNKSYSFGTGKMTVLGAFASAILLGAIALFMAGESILRLLHPVKINFSEAIMVACAGLAVNVVSALLLQGGHHHHGHDHHQHHHGDHGHDHDQSGSHSHTHSHDHDLNLKAAYLHVIADAATSLLAIFALTGGLIFGWGWLDPAMGIVGSVVIAQWAYTLIRDTTVILLDREPDNCDLNLEIRKALEDGDTAIADLHIWQLGVNKFAAIIALVARTPKSPDAYKQLLKQHDELVHITIEVHQCPANLESPA